VIRSQNGRRGRARETGHGKTEKASGAHRRLLAFTWDKHQLSPGITTTTRPQKGAKINPGQTEEIETNTIQKRHEGKLYCSITRPTAQTFFGSETALVFKQAAQWSILRQEERQLNRGIAYTLRDGHFKAKAAIQHDIR
jgi:hypothetical protein